MKELIETTLDSLANKGLEATPKNYAKEFYKKAEELNHEIEDLKKFYSILDELGHDEKKVVQEKNIKTATELIQILTKRVKKADISRFVNQMTTLMKPSINQELYDKIDEIVLELSNEPEKLLDNKTIELFGEITNERVRLDRQALREKSEDMKKLTHIITKYYDRSLIQSDDTADEIMNIRQEIESLELSTQSNREITTLQANLIDTIYKLENSIEKNKIDLIKGQHESCDLHQQIDALQEELAELQKEKNIDFLTGVMNRRGYTTAVAKIENEFNFFESKYAVVFYDIDNFKVINDTYGHECGDVILNIFATILKKLTREDDIVCRYGGEEFVALIHYNEENEVKRYIKRVKEIISQNKFIYNNEIKLKVQFSAGVSFRNKYDSYENSVKKADKLLYEAKHSGKNKIIFDDSIVL